MHHTSSCVLVIHKTSAFLNIGNFAKKLMASNIKVFAHSINRFITPFFSGKCYNCRKYF